MASLLFNEEKPRKTVNVPDFTTPESIMSSLFTFRNTAHKFHLNSMVIGVGSHAQHIALDGLYKGIQELQDTILEQMMGYLGRPINAVTNTSSPEYRSTDQAISLCDDIHQFSKSLISYATSNDMPNIENVAQELSGLAAHTKYFLMFK